MNKRRRKHVHNPHDGAAMSFEEIGQELGISRTRAWTAYKSGMRKITHGGKLLKLRAIVALARSKDCPNL